MEEFKAKGQKNTHCLLNGKTALTYKGNVYRKGWSQGFEQICNVPQEIGNGNIREECVHIQPIRHRSSQARMKVFHCICKELFPYIIKFSIDLQIPCTTLRVDDLICFALMYKEIYTVYLPLVFNYKWDGHICIFEF